MRAIELLITNPLIVIEPVVDLGWHAAAAARRLRGEKVRFEKDVYEIDTGPVGPWGPMPLPFPRREVERKIVPTKNAK